ncbi:MAG TPA: OmpA family protein [Longimicrobiaceae bacterium]|jgi:outer membrane protein OmpA-like peptidoglycan-associated protein|nr:OmpA family protein [Longimicrobiaceae bacterium]
MAARTLLDSLELPQAQCVDVEDEQALARHAVPALEGDWLQRQGRRAARVSLTGVLTGQGAREALGELRDRFRAAQPVDFVADITTATRVGRVLVEALEVREVAGRPERFEYAFGLREFLEPPRPQTEEPPPRPTPIDPATEQGQLDVEVTVEGQPDFEMSRISVTVTGRGADGNVSTRTLTERSANVWSARELDAGEYGATATAEAERLTGSATGTVSPGQTARIQIVLRPQQAVAAAFVVHFRFDSAFVEPCMRAVLGRALGFAASSGHTADRLLVVGHTDRVGPGDYNQSLSERRARAVFAFLTFGRDPDGAVREWTAIRQTRPAGTVTTLADSWGVREYQWMLQDLGWYPGTIDGDKGTGNSLTNQAIRAFRCHKGLPPGTHVDDELWEALIRDYLGQDNFAFGTARLLPNCPGEPLRWLGCGEEDPVNNTPSAHRPNRRVELLFVTGAALPCRPPEPDTFRLPPASPAGTAWCIGPPPANSGHACFLARGAAQAGRLLFQPAEPAVIDAVGRVSREVRQPDGSVALERVASRPIVAITAAGEFQRGEQGRGEPSPDTTRGGGGTTGDPRGTFGPYAGKPEGIWTLEVLPQPRSLPVLLRLEDDEDGPVRGGVVCRRLHDGDLALNVVIVAAPGVREIRVPAVAHVMTALHPTTRQVRTCAGFGGAAERQASSLGDDQVRAAFDAANRTWRQGRIRFELADIVHEAYAFRTDCEVDGGEFAFLLDRCAYPRAVNVFFVGDLAGNGEAGFGLSPEDAASQGLAISGCAVGDRFQTTILGPPISTPVDEPLREQVLAHELGHFLNLPHVTGAAAADPNRLMQPSGSTGANRLIAPDEVTVARGSQGAADDCTPLSLTVTGAARVGGTLSHRFVFVRDPASPATVTADAVIPDAMLDPARGALVMAGGTAGANPKQQVVPTGTPATVEITATYTPVGGTPVVRRVFVHVVDFTLAVPGQTPETPGGSTFLIRRQAGGSVRVVANLSSTPFCIPSTLVTWDPDDAATRLDDPLQRTLALDAVRDVTLRATVAGITRQVRITTFDVAITNNTAPFDTTVAQVQTEGILSTDLASYDIGDLFNTQAGSVFRIRVDLPGAALPLTASLASTDAAGTALETQVFPLTRLAGDRFVSLPILAIPAAIPRADITFAAPRSIEVLRTRAQGRVRLQVQGRLAAVPPVDARVRGRVLELCTLTIQGASPNPALLLGTANRVMAQDGIEFRILTALPTLNSPQLLDIARTTCPLTIGGDALRGAEETALFALGRAACAANFIVYFIRSDSLALRGCSAYPAGNPGVTVCDGATQYTMGHEIGHVLNLPHNGALNNLMNTTTSGLPAAPSQVRLTNVQCALMDGSGFLVFRV